MFKAPDALLSAALKDHCLLEAEPERSEEGYAIELDGVHFAEIEVTGTALMHHLCMGFSHVVGRVRSFKSDKLFNSVRSGTDRLL